MLGMGAACRLAVASIFLILIGCSKGRNIDYGRLYGDNGYFKAGVREDSEVIILDYLADQNQILFDIHGFYTQILSPDRITTFEIAGSGPFVLNIVNGEVRSLGKKAQGLVGTLKSDTNNPLALHFNGDIEAVFNLRRIDGMGEKTEMKLKFNILISRFELWQLIEKSTRRILNQGHHFQTGNCLDGVCIIQSQWLLTELPGLEKARKFYLYDYSHVEILLPQFISENVMPLSFRDCIISSAIHCILDTRNILTGEASSREVRMEQVP
jgi:hypothetical protein